MGMVERVRRLLMGLKVAGRAVRRRERLVMVKVERSRRGMLVLKKREFGKRRKTRKRGILRFLYPYVSIKGSGSGKMPGVWKGEDGDEEIDWSEIGNIIIRL